MPENPGNKNKKRPHKPHKPHNYLLVPAPFVKDKEEVANMTHEELVELRRRDQRSKKVARALQVGGITALAGAAGIVGHRMLAGEDMGPPTPSHDELNPPPATAPADIDTARPNVDMAQVRNAVAAAKVRDTTRPDGSSGATKTDDKRHGNATQHDGFIPVNIPYNVKPVRQETPEEKAYRGKINGSKEDGLIIQRDMEDTLRGKMMAEGFVDTKVPYEAAEFRKIPRDTAVEIMHRVHSQTEEAAWIAFKLEKPFGSVTREEQQKYWDSLTPDQQAQLRGDMKNPPDVVGEMIGRNARMARQKAFNQWLKDNGFPEAVGAGINR